MSPDARLQVAVEARSASDRPRLLFSVRRHRGAPRKTRTGLCVHRPRLSRNARTEPESPEAALSSPRSSSAFSGRRGQRTAGQSVRCDLKATGSVRELSPNCEGIPVLTSKRLSRALRLSERVPGLDRFSKHRFGNMPLMSPSTTCSPSDLACGGRERVLRHVLSSLGMHFCYFWLRPLQNIV